jgi:hypothetical protein
MEKKKHTCQYIDIDTADLWKAIPEFDVTVRGEVGPVLDIISDCRTQGLCSHLSTTSRDCDHNGHSNYIYCREDGRE